MLDDEITCREHTDFVLVSEFKEHIMFHRSKDFIEVEIAPAGVRYKN